MDTRPILVVDDQDDMRCAIQETLKRKGYRIVTAHDGKEALERIGGGGIRLVVSDVKMPCMDGLSLLRESRKISPFLPFILVTAFGTVQQAVEAVKEGASDYVLKPFTAEELQEKIRKALEVSAGGQDEHGVVTNDPKMLDVLAIARNVARSDVNVVITGESGTGKELLARFIHKMSPRHTHPLIAVNCASIPETLLESELFGYEKGAFTGAFQRHIGKFEMAHGSTLLLDEIAEMSMALQAKLLRILQEKEVERLGASRPVPVDFRVIATTNRNLDKEVEKGRFREDLYYRLNVVPLAIPSLKERPGDVRLLVEHFCREIVRRLGVPPKKFSQEAIETIEAMRFKGNVRELKNLVERAVILSHAETIGVDGLFIDRIIAQTPNPHALYCGQKLKSIEKDLILETLEGAGGNKTHAARILGISVRTLRNKLKEYGRGC